jgi:Fe-S-cluster containining protein
VTDTGFPCTSCGVCCRVGPRLVKGWPLNADKTACAYLGADNRCTIYAQRPAICRMDRLPMPAAHAFVVNAELCNRMQAAEGIDPAYRVDAERSPVVRLLRALERA